MELLRGLPYRSFPSNGFQAAKISKYLKHKPKNLNSLNHERKRKKEAIDVYKKNIAYWTEKLKLAKKEVETCKNEIAHSKKMIEVWKSK